MAETRPSRPMRRPTFRSWHARLLGGVIAVVLLVVALLVLDYTLQVPVTVQIDGASYRIRTRADTVQEALDAAGVVIDPEDTVWPPLDAALDDDHTIAVYKAHAVALQVADGVRRVRTQAIQPLDILAEQGITVGPYDMVQVDGQDIPASEIASLHWAESPLSLRVVSSVAIVVVDGDQSYTIQTTQTDVGRALDSAGFKLYLADQVTPDLSTSVTPGLVIEIVRSLPVIVLADGQRLETRTLGPTVADALNAIGLAPIGQDYTIPALETLLEAGMTIQLVRVTEEIVTKDEPIPFSTIYQPDATLLPDEKRVIQEGVDGVRTSTIRVRYENGKEVSRVIQEEWITRPPTPRMIVLGERVKSP